MTNPWNIPPGEALALSTLVEHGGSCKVAAATLERSRTTIDTQVHRAMRRMSARTRIQALIEWDRWQRAQEVTQ